MEDDRLVKDELKQSSKVSLMTDRGIDSKDATTTFCGDIVLTLSPSGILKIDFRIG